MIKGAIKTPKDGLGNVHAHLNVQASIVLRIQISEGEKILDCRILARGEADCKFRALRTQNFVGNTFLEKFEEIS